mmetsp:Transcript_5175/g.16230  ORF Transcript_5175/g.16230 Transcript_5175/m.16230 type:complete len:263 (+) Transcript_5175:185-973(+)
MVRIQPADLSEHRKPPSTRVRYGATHARRQEARTGRSASEERLLLTCYHPREDRVLREVEQGPVGAVVEKREGIRTWRASRAATAGASWSAADSGGGGQCGQAERGDGGAQRVEEPLARLARGEGDQRPSWSQLGPPRPAPRPRGRRTASPAPGAASGAAAGRHGAGAPTGGGSLPRRWRPRPETAGRGAREKEQRRRVRHRPHLGHRNLAQQAPGRRAGPAGHGRLQFTSLEGVHQRRQVEVAAEGIGCGRPDARLRLRLG